MKTLRELYKIGNGPSSSHTMGPKERLSGLKIKTQKQTDLIFICMAR